MPTGRVVNWRQSQGYGFITPEDGGQDSFLHFTEFDGPPHKIHNGLRVSYEEAPGQHDKPKAVNVQAIGRRKPREDDLADLLTAAELRRELAKLFDDASNKLVQFALQHGWVE